MRPSRPTIQQASALLGRSGKAFGRLLLNWGILVVVVAAVLVVRYRGEAEARAPLPPPVVHLSAADARQWRAFPSYHGVVPVLLYHAVKPGKAELQVSPRLFAQQMLALKTAGFHAITLAQYVQFMHGDRRGLPSRPILLTFDDGRLDAYRAVNDLLRRYGFHATMFTFAAWPTTNPGFSLSWDQLRQMQQSGIWSVQEHGGSGHEYVVYDAAGQHGGVYGNLRYIRNSSGRGGHLETFSAFAGRVTSNVLWGEHLFTDEIPGFRPLAFAVPLANYGQQETNDPRIPGFVLPWLKRHFQVIFGGDYLDQGPHRPDEIRPRSSADFSYRISMDSRMTPPGLYCRLKDWITGVPLWKEYRCLRLGTGPT